MSTVFHGFFSDNLRRLGTRPDVRSRETIESVTTGPKTFADVLAETEKPALPAHPNPASTSAIPSATPGEPFLISNLTSQEQTVLLPSPALTPSPTIIPEASATVSDVKDSTSAESMTHGRLPPQVSASPPEAPSKDWKSGPPNSPVIMSARRILEDDPKRAERQQYSRRDIRQMITTAGRFHGIDPLLSLAVAHTESSLRPQAESNDGHHSKGVFQLLDSTGQHMMKELGVKEAYDPFDPALSSHLGVGYLRRLHDLFSVDTKLIGTLTTKAAKSSDQLEKLAVAAYNAGEGAVARAQRKAQESGQDPTDYNSVRKFLPQQTQRYVATVTALKRALSDLA